MAVKGGSWGGGLGGKGVVVPGKATPPSHAQPRPVAPPLRLVWRGASAAPEGEEGPGPDGQGGCGAGPSGCGRAVPAPRLPAADSLVDDQDGPANCRPSGVNRFAKSGRPIPPRVVPAKATSAAPDNGRGPAAGRRAVGLGGASWTKAAEGHDEGQPLATGGVLTPGLQPKPLSKGPTVARVATAPLAASASWQDQSRGSWGGSSWSSSGYGPARTGYGGAPQSWAPYNPPAAWRAAGTAAAAAAAAVPPQATTSGGSLPVRLPYTVVLVGVGLQPGIEKDIEACVRDVAIQGSFSCADEVRYVARTTCYIDFPHQDAAKAFMEATGGNLTVGDRAFRMHLHGSESTAPAQTGQEEQPEQPEPTPSLLLRYIGGLSEDDIYTALSQYGQVKAVKIPLNFAGKPKTFARVDFHSISEASTALGRLENAGSMICKRRISAIFAQPETDEDVARVNAAKQAEEEKLKESKQQALNGINGSMWAEYMQLFKDGSISSA